MPIDHPGTALLGQLNDWRRDRSGGIAILFAVMLPVLISAVGMSIDLAQAYLVRERLSRALDAAALAVAGSGLESQAAIEARVNEFLEANYPEDRIGAVVDFDVSIHGDDVNVTAKASFNTGFMWVIGIDHLNVDKSSTVRKQVKGVEAILVLDNTGSMSTNNNIATLRTAATNFVNTMFAKAQNPNDIKIGIVPYANTVRVGLYGIGLVPDPLTGAAKPDVTYNDGDPFVTLPSGYGYAMRSGTTYNTSTKKYSFNNSNSDHDASNKWYGCVIEHNPNGWNAAVDTNDPYPSDVTDNFTGDWDIYRDSSYCYGKMVSGSCKTGSGDNPKTHNVLTSSTPNAGCPYANIIPLTSTKQDLLHTIGAMQPHGNTLGNVGMVWALRMLSPEEPFEEGADWDSQYWRKAVIMMTDGDNTKESDYSYFWLNKRNKINVNTTGAGTVANPYVLGYNQRFEKVCDELYDKEVLVYTVVFTSSVNQDTKNFYKRCATNDSMYFYAPSQAELLSVFGQIARELSNLYIKE